MWLNFHTHRPLEANEYTIGSAGLHPWYLQAENWAEQLAALEQRLVAGGVQMVGECGLDKRCGAPYELQRQAFEAQLELAERYARPVVVHCVHAYGDLMQLRTQRAWAQPWVVHGFTGTYTLYRQLAQLGIEVSVGVALLHNEKVQAAVGCLASGDFFLETDEADVPVKKLYEAAAQLLKIDVETLMMAIGEKAHHLLSAKGNAERHARESAKGNA
ncbi:MAG: TatD family hydrolase [Bacteroidales bacterium]|nr:TatD family hydrolase [Bacteroidales bacterium]